MSSPSISTQTNLSKHEKWGACRPLFFSHANPTPPGVMPIDNSAPLGRGTAQAVEGVTLPTKCQPDTARCLCEDEVRGNPVINMCRRCRPLFYKLVHHTSQNDNTDVGCRFCLFVMTKCCAFCLCEDEVRGNPVINMCRRCRHII